LKQTNAADDDDYDGDDDDVGSWVKFSLL